MILEELEKLKNETNVLYKQYTDFKKDFDDKLKKIIQGDLPDNYLDITISHLENEHYNNHKYRVCVDIRFLNEKGERDFGSSFDVYIYDNEISMSCGTIGEYTRQRDKYNVRRDYLKVDLWNKEDELIEFVKNNYNFELIKKYDDAIMKQEDLKRHIEFLEREYKQAEIITKLIPNTKFVDRDGDIYTLNKITEKRYYYTCDKYHTTLHENKDVVIEQFFRNNYKFQ